MWALYKKEENGQTREFLLICEHYQTAYAIKARMEKRDTAKPMDVYLVEKINVYTSASQWWPFEALNGMFTKTLGKLHKKLTKTLFSKSPFARYFKKAKKRKS